MNTIHVVIASNEDGDVWTISAHHEYEDAEQAKNDAVEASRKARDMTGEMFTIEETVLS